MRFMHIADLHIGKKLCETSLIPDQEYALDFIAREAEARRPDAILIAGDVYDRAIPGIDAVSLLDRFISRLMNTGAQVFMIGGNHDSQERLAFGRGLMARGGLIISEPYRGKTEKYALGDTDIWLLPHIRPREIEPYFEGARFEGVDEAVEAVLARESIDKSRKNVILVHQYVTARGESAERSDSEVDPIGGESSVDVSLFDDFDYVALGHLHAAQRAGRETARYSGSPVKYSFSETRHVKSFVFGTIGENGVDIELVPIPQLHGMREMKGKLADILAAAEKSDDYIKVTLTDDTPPLSPMERLEAFYPNVLRLEMELRGAAEVEPIDTRTRRPMELFAEFFLRSTGDEISGELLDMAKDAFEKVSGEGGR